jgi:hypothetical protein
MIETALFFLDHLSENIFFEGKRFQTRERYFRQMISSVVRWMGLFVISCLLVSNCEVTGSCFCVCGPDEGLLPIALILVVWDWK